MRPLLGLRESILLAVHAGCAMRSPPAEPAAPQTADLEAATRDRCVAEHPPGDPPTVLSTADQPRIDAEEVAAACRALLPAVEVPDRGTSSGSFPRAEPTVAEAERLCDPAGWMSLEAALCIAEAARLPQGVEPPMARLEVDDALNAVVWTISVTVWRRSTEAYGAVMRVDAVDGTVRFSGQAHFTSGRDWPARATAGSASGGAASWIRAGLDEHASVAAFARHVLELLALGAPSALVDAAGAALRDEVRHAEASFVVAARLAGRRIAPGPLDTSAPPRSTPVAVLVALAREGCLGETLAAAEARVAAGRSDDLEIRRVLEQIAGDETRHAALAWRTLAWGLGAFPEAGAAVADALAERPRPATQDAWGILGPAERDALARRTFRQVVGPAVVALGFADARSEVPVRPRLEPSLRARPRSAGQTLDARVAEDDEGNLEWDPLTLELVPADPSDPRSAHDALVGAIADALGLPQV